MSTETDRIEIINERIYPVTRETLFAAFADPDQLALWWGPDGFTNSITEFDLQPGGTWLITMTASNGTDFHNRWSFIDVAPGERIHARHLEPVHDFTLEMTFADHADGASLTWRMLFDRTEENEEIEKFLHAANDQNLKRLAELLDRPKH